MKKANFKKSIDGLKQFCRSSARHSFLSFLVLLLIALLLGGILFYKYNILAGQREPEISGQPIEFKENLYQKILGEWQKRGERFEAAKEKEYLDIFR